MSFTQIDVDTIMPPRMRTQSAGQPAAESLGGGTGVQVGRGGRGRRPMEGNDERVDDFEDLNGQGNDKGCELWGFEGNSYPHTSSVSNEELMEIRMVMMHNENVRRTWECDSEWAPVMRCKLESKSWKSRLVGVASCVYDRFHELVATEPKTIQKVVQISSALTDEAMRNGSIKK
ncbi:hypothetical protein Tco_1119398 [Tanacetum coccineum]